MLVVTDEDMVEDRDTLTFNVVDDEASIDSFDASDPDEDTGMVTLSWTTDYAKSWVLQETNTGTTINVDTPTIKRGEMGETDVTQPSVMTTYTLEATGRNGKTDTDMVQVRGQDLSLVLPTVRSFQFDGEDPSPSGSVEAGEKFSLLWATSVEATTVTITADTGGTVTKPAGDRMAEFTLNSPDTMTTYSIFATGPGGDGEEYADSVTVTVTEATQATIDSFEDDLEGLAASYGADVMLSWMTMNAASIGIRTAGGVVVEIPMADMQLTRNGGSVTVNPLEPTRYTLTVMADGPNAEEVTEYVDVNVNPGEAARDSLIRSRG